MCGRYTLLTPQMELEIKAIVKAAEDKLRQRNSQNVQAHISEEDIFPKMLAPILAPKDGSYIPYPGIWGFTGWRTQSKRPGKDGKPTWNKPKPLFNTKAETATTQHPSNRWEQLFADSLGKRRCIIPTTGFYEWQYSYDKKPGEKPTEKGNEYFFSLPDSNITYVAGIWANEVDPETNEKWLHYSMMTTAANDSIREVHGRMPVVLRKEELEQWLYGDYLKLLDRNQVRLEREKKTA